MPRFTFTVTRDITESATVTIEAASIKEAHDKALKNHTAITGWENDEGNNPEPYIPDEDDYKEED
jgi:hypothetical protein